jgi:hypothetical protein
MTNTTGAHTLPDWNLTLRIAVLRIAVSYIPREGSFRRSRGLY